MKWIVKGFMILLILFVALAAASSEVLAQSYYDAFPPSEIWKLTLSHHSH